MVNISNRRTALIAIKYAWSSRQESFKSVKRMIAASKL